jgi:hypothetical protein
LKQFELPTGAMDGFPTFGQVFIVLLKSLDEFPRIKALLRFTMGKVSMMRAAALRGGGRLGSGRRVADAMRFPGQGRDGRRRRLS